MAEQRGRWVREPGLQEYIRLPHGTIYALRREGLLKTSKIGRAVFYDLDQVDEMMVALRAKQDGEVASA